MPKTKEKSLQSVKDIILKVLHENSGGMKEIELGLALSKDTMPFGIAKIDLIDTAITVLQMEKKIVVLAYTWHKGKGIDREKRFIYTP